MAILATGLAVSLFVLALARRRSARSWPAALCAGSGSGRPEVRFQLGAAIGAAAILLALVLIVGAEHFATNWQPLGPNAWGGTTDVGLEATSRNLGWAALAFGLVMEDLTFHQWLGTQSVHQKARVRSR